MFTDISEGVEYASLVVEAATENETLKLEIFKTLDIAVQMILFWPPTPPLFQ